MNKKKLSVLLIITLEIAIILELGYLLVFNMNTVTPVRTRDVIFSESKLSNFYEPRPGIIESGKLYSFPSATKYHINKDSIHGLTNYPVGKGSSTFRIITLGDSFVFGLYVDTDKNWVSLFEELMNNNFKCEKYDKFEVINLGVFGYDAEYSVERFRKRGIKYAPDLVIWMHTDLNRIVKLMYPLSVKYKEAGLRSGEEQKWINEGRYYEPWIKAKNEIIANTSPESMLKFQEEAIKKIDSYYQGDLVFMILPHRLSTDQEAIIEAFAGKRDNSFILDEERFNSKISTFSDGHPDIEGHKLIAETLYKYIVDDNIVDCI